MAALVPVLLPMLMLKLRMLLSPHICLHSLLGSWWPKRQKAEGEVSP